MKKLRIVTQLTVISFLSLAGSWARASCDVAAVRKAAFGQALIDLPMISTRNVATRSAGAPEIHITLRSDHRCPANQVGVHVTRTSTLRGTNYYQWGLTYEVLADCSLRLLASTERPGELYATVCN